MKTHFQLSILVVQTLDFLVSQFQWLVRLQEFVHHVHVSLHRQFVGFEFRLIGRFTCNRARFCNRITVRLWCNRITNIVRGHHIRLLGGATLTVLLLALLGFGAPDRGDHRARHFTQLGNLAVRLLVVALDCKSHLDLVDLVLVGKGLAMLGISLQSLNDGVLLGSRFVLDLHIFESQQLECVVAMESIC